MVTKAEKSNGQKLVDKIAGWFGSYLFCSDPDLPLVLAMWGIGSWVFDRFYTWPYLVVTAATKGAGKSRVLELEKVICRNAWLQAEPTPAYVLRKAEKLSGHFTLLWDEAEAAAASDAKSFFSAVVNSGYRRGHMIGRAKGPDDVVEYRAYFPKAFALIGDPTGTIRDRSIIAEMSKGNAPREYAPEIAEGEGAALVNMIQAVLGQGDGTIGPAAPEWLDTRDREIWGSVFGLAEWLKLDRPTMERLYRFAADNIGAKTAPKRKSTSIEDEEKSSMARYAERALADLASVMHAPDATHTGHLHSAHAVELLRAIPTAPWRTFLGKGLDTAALAGLVQRFGVHTAVVPELKGRGKKMLNGYRYDDVMASAGKHSQGSAQ
jgi:hypothetical protein